ncbi:hypothetical protein KCU73_g12002, partial [Aureobasidium melanogenum]
NSNAGPQWFFCRTYTRIAVQCTSTAFCSTTLQLQLHITTPQPFHKQHLIFHKLVRSNHLAKHINMVITTAKTNQQWYSSSTHPTHIFLYYTPAAEFHDTDSSNAECVFCVFDACDAAATDAAETSIATTDITTATAAAKDKPK